MINEKRLLIAVLVALLMTLTSVAFSEGGVGVGGVVIDVNGNPIPNVQVVVYDANNAVAGTTSTGADGHFIISVLPGSYTVKLSKPGYVDKTVQVTVSKTTLYADLGTITLDYSIKISLTTAFLSVPILNTVTIPVAITNQGSSPENISIDIEPQCGIQVAMLASGIAVSELKLNPGETQSLTLSLSTPYLPSQDCKVKIFFIGSVALERDITLKIVNQTLGILSTQLTSFQVNPGSTVQLQIKVTNPLPKTIRTALSLELPPNWVGSLTSGSLVVNQLSLNPGETVQIQMSIGVPKQAQPGNYVVTVIATGLSPYFIEKLPINIEVVIGNPLLRLETTTPHVDVYAGQTAKFGFTIENLGDADCVAGFQVQGLPQDYRWNIVDQQGNVFSQVYLKAGGTLTLYLSVFVPPLAEPSLISLNLIASANASRDSIPLTLGVLGRYQLSFVTQNFYMEMTPGSNGTFSVQVKNTGYSTVTNVALGASTSASGFTVSISPSSVPMLKPGDTATFQVSISVDPTTDAGDYYVTLLLKGDNIEPLQRDLHVYVRPANSPIYYIAGAALLLIIGVFLAYRKFGRR
ncbi:MAG: NEW3 domain-containing protein [Infirmifilum sp.]